jgi:hypothetical protein
VLVATAPHENKERQRLSVSEFLSYSTKPIQVVKVLEQSTRNQILLSCRVQKLSDQSLVHIDAGSIGRSWFWSGPGSFIANSFAFVIFVAGTFDLHEAGCLILAPILR